MKVSSATFVYVWNIVRFTGKEKLDGVAEERTAFPRKRLKDRNTLYAKLLKATEIAVVPKDAVKADLKEADMKFVPYAKDYKPEEGFEVLGERQVESETVLSDGEKALVKECADERDEFPATSDEVLSEFAEFCGFDLAA